ncbi:hypothetical protein EW146_g9635 [Bondarzewia mesenterica]|uniref:DUF1682-domain-containing protein n=1 Tax=Bondarzewia mesenterica TaxID=1095465 RepID=A0A4S4L609_9AGAM|nr:hypothetical protein EW146_g9635 [Bondarzewia mesenterica]
MQVNRTTIRHANPNPSTHSVPRDLVPPSFPLSSMSNPILAPLSNLFQYFTPPPPVLHPDYEGLEFSWKFFVFRPALLKNEVFLLSGILLYLLFFWLGKRNNEKRANGWLDAHAALYETQFSHPSHGGLTQDGYSDFFDFSTGRRNVASLHTIFTLRPRHDLLQLIYQFCYANIYDLNWTPTDEIQLDFKLANPSVPDIIWALVTKHELRLIKHSRWDLTFTRATDNAAVPNTLTVMSEFADVTENVLKVAGPVLSALQDPKILPYFRSLSITDQPRDRPSTRDHPREKHVILSLSSLPPSATADTVPLITALFTFIDNLGKITLRPETKSKIKKVRDDFLKDLKEEAEKEKREEAADARQAAKKKAEEERIAKLSAAAQQKIIERDRKRNLRKTQGRVSVRK